MLVLLLRTISPLSPRPMALADLEHVLPMPWNLMFGSAVLLPHVQSPFLTSRNGTWLRTGSLRMNALNMLCRRELAESPVVLVSATVTTGLP